MKKEIKVLMPELKPDVKTAVLCAWLKDEGEEVKAGEVLFEVETDKVVTQVEATKDGKVMKQLVEEGDEVEVNSAVAIIEED